MRYVTIPASSFHEEIRSIQEYIDSPGTPGMVKVEVSRCDEKGCFLSGIPVPYTIEGDSYKKLLGDGKGWAKDGKPIGTFRNEDLWYFIDQIRAAKS